MKKNTIDFVTMTFAELIAQQWRQSVYISEIAHTYVSAFPIVFIYMGAGSRKKGVGAA